MTSLNGGHRNGHLITEWSKVLGAERLTGSIGKELLGFEVEGFNQSLDLCALGESERILTPR